MKKTTGIVLLLCLLLPIAALAERYENLYALHQGVIDGDHDAVYIGESRKFGPLIFDLPKDRGEIRISADPPVTLEGTIVINSGIFHISGIDLVARTDNMRREPLEVVGRDAHIPEVTFHGNLSAFSPNGQVRWGLACRNAIVHVVGDVEGGQAGGRNRAVLAVNSQVTIEGRVRTLVDEAEMDGPPDETWFHIARLSADEAERGVQALDAFVKIVDPTEEEPLVFNPTYL